MPRGKQVKPTFVHINVLITREAHDYFSAKDNMSKEIREVLAEYVRNKTDNPPNIVRVTNEEPQQ